MKTPPIFLLEVIAPGPRYFENIFKSVLEAAGKNGAPLYCGEYEVIDFADNPFKIRWPKDIPQTFEKFRIGHVLWNCKEKGFGFVNEHFKDIKDDFIAVI